MQRRIAFIRFFRNINKSKECYNSIVSSKNYYYLAVAATSRYSNLVIDLKHQNCDYEI